MVWSYSFFIYHQTADEREAAPYMQAAKYQWSEIANEKQKCVNCNTIPIITGSSNMMSIVAERHRANIAAIGTARKDQ